MESRHAAWRREWRARLSRLGRAARTVPDGLARLLPRVGRPARADVLCSALPALGQADAADAGVHPKDPRRERRPGARGARPVLSVGGDTARATRDGVPVWRDARRPADRTPGDRSLPGGPDVDPVRGTGGARARGLRRSAGVPILTGGVRMTGR